MCQDTLVNMPDSFWRQHLKGISDPWKSPNSFSCRQRLQISGDILEKAQTKVEAIWADFSLRLQIWFNGGEKSARRAAEALAYWPPCLHINQAFSAYLVEGCHFSDT